MPCTAGLKSSKRNCGLLRFNTQWLFSHASIRKDKHCCPHRLFTGEDPPATLQDFRVFGSPCYVLKKELQDGSKMNKWTERSWQGVYIGHSSCHSGHIPLIYNHNSTRISPQYHVNHDDFFQTIGGISADQLDTCLDKLFQSTAHWSYNDKFDDNPYTFDSFWSELDTVPDPFSITGRKRKRSKPQVSIKPITDGSLHSPSLSRGSSESITDGNSTPQAAS
jgi:hypothetical protein